MKPRLFILALVLLPNISAEARAQVVRLPGAPYGPGHPKTYDQGYRDGVAYAMNGNTAFPYWLGNNGYQTHTSYVDGVRDGMQAVSAAKRSLNGGVGMGGFGIRGSGINLDLTPVFNGQAAKNYQDAYQSAIENQKLRTETSFDMRRINTSYRGEQQMQHAHATPAEHAAFARARLPAQLSANEFDPARGVIQWPGALMRAEFDEGRTRLVELFSQAVADPHNSGLGTQNYRDIEHAVDEMSEKLHSEIAQLMPNEYIPAGKFLKSLLHQARTPAEALAKQ